MSCISQEDIIYAAGTETWADQNATVLICALWKLHILPLSIKQIRFYWLQVRYTYTPDKYTGCICGKKKKQTKKNYKFVYGIF